jgi:hypothetical protein
MTHLSTTTLMAALAQEPRWSTQIEIARLLKGRRDVFNISPLCEFLVQVNRNREVQRAVAECIASQAPQEGVRWLSGCIFDPEAKPAEQELALRGLADLRMPTLTVPILMRVCRSGFNPEVRRAAFFRLGRSGRLEAVRFLIRLSEGTDRVLAKQAQDALETIVTLHRGLEGAMDRLLDLAGERARRGKRLEAARFLGAAVRLGRRGGLVLEQRFRQRLAA